MKIGDKVRVLDGSEEGRVIEFKNNGIVEIEIEDGFTIPVMKKNLVVVAEAEATYFEKKVTQTSQETKETSLPSNKASIGHEYFLGYIPTNENDLAVNFYNYSGKKMLFNISEKKDHASKSIAHGALDAGKSVFVTYLKMNQFDQWPELFIQIIEINHTLSPLNQAKEYFIKPKPKSFFISKGPIPGESKQGYIIGIKNEIKIEPEKIKESFFNPTETPKEISRNRQGGTRVIDLHIENIKTDYEGLKKEDILEIQVNHFEKELDKAVQDGVESIKFIHGIGNGSLRHILHKKLSQASHIRYFEDADKGKFGYGATEVHL